MRSRPSSRRDHRASRAEIVVPAPFVIHGNLDCEARWTGTALPGHVAVRTSYYATLLAILAPRDRNVEVWAPVGIATSRLQRVPAWTPPAMQVGTPSHSDLAWADPDAKAANDRQVTYELALSHRDALVGACIVDSVGSVEQAIEAAHATSSRWVVKARWTSAGRDRCHGSGKLLSDQRTRIERLLAQSGALVFEPWVERVLDVGLCGRVDGTTVELEAPHGLATDTFGTFAGIDLSPPALEPAELARLDRAARYAADHLRSLPYTGPFSIDAFVYRDANGNRRFHPLCEINARHTFGTVARAFHRRTGATRLGFAAPPPSATVLIAPGDDRVTAWIA